MSGTNDRICVLGSFKDAGVLLLLIQTDPSGCSFPSRNLMGVTCSEKYFTHLFSKAKKSSSNPDFKVEVTRKVPELDTSHHVTGGCLQYVQVQCTLLVAHRHVV